MTVTTTAHAAWSSSPHELPQPVAQRIIAETVRTVDAQPDPDAVLAARMLHLLTAHNTAGDPTARARFAALLHAVTGWAVFDDQDERAYVSRLWAEDWDSPEDAAYDER